ncbi:DUF7520 family protein [Halonotius terrestris]
MSGQQIVVGVYLVIVCFTGIAVYLTAGAVDEINAPRFVFLIEFPANRLGLATSSALTIAVVLGVLSDLVMMISERLDDAKLNN